MAAFLRRKRDAGARADRVSLAGEGGEERAVDVVLRKKIVLGLAMVAAFIVLLELSFPAAVPGSGIELSIGQIAREEIVAPFDFDVLKPAEELEEERNLAASGVVPVFELDEGVQAEQRQSAGRAAVEDLRDTRRSGVDQAEAGHARSARSRPFRDHAADPHGPRQCGHGRRHRARGPERSLRERRSAGRVERRRRPSRPSCCSGARTRAWCASATSCRWTESRRSSGERPSGRWRTARRLWPYANWSHRSSAATSFTIRTRPSAGDRKPGTRSASTRAGTSRRTRSILQRGERITQEHVSIVRSMGVKRSELLQLRTGPTRFFPSLGRVLEALLLLGSLVLYLSVRRPRMLLDTRCRLLFMVLVVVVMAGAATVRGMPGASEYLVPIAILAMLASMLFDFEVAVISTVFVVLLAGDLHGLRLFRSCSSRSSPASSPLTRSGR